MARAIWSGAINFGLVSVPVKLFSAVRQKDVSFHQVDEASGSRIKYKRVSEKTGREVPYERIAKGYEVDDGEYVVIDPKELEQFVPEATKRVDISDFVDLAEIDPIHFQHTYFLAPDKGGDKAYALLFKAMDDEDKIGIGRVVIRNKEYLAAIRPYGKRGLALETMYFPDEVVDIDTIPGVPDRAPRVGEKELKMARQLVGSLSGEWEPDHYRDTYREQVVDLIERKAAGETIESVAPASTAPAVIDLMAALEASVKAAKSARARHPAAHEPEAEAAPAPVKAARKRKSA